MANRVYNVKNRSASLVVYRIPELNIRREFAPGETKKITFQELQSLSYQPGGRAMMTEFLQIQEDSIANALNIPREAEYYMSEQQIVELLKTGSNDALLDCLEFAPTGVIDLLKKYAIDLPLTDTTKMNIIKEKTGFDVDLALKNKLADETPEDGEDAAAGSGSTTKRRTTPNYKVVEKK